MKKAFPLLISIIAILVCCKQKKANTFKAISFYDSVNNQINITRPPIQKLIDNSTTVIYILRDDKNAVIDTAILWRLLDKAKRMSAIRIKSIEQITEVDESINYKQRILKEELLLKQLLANEIPESIEIFGEPGEDRYSRASHLLLPKLKELKRALNDVAAAKNEFKDKYNFTRPPE
jgi:methylaspartate ammonia-lyase